jgi:hypothetical protein
MSLSLARTWALFPSCNIFFFEFSVSCNKKKKRGYRVCSSGYAATDTS